MEIHIQHNEAPMTVIENHGVVHIGESRSPRAEESSAPSAVQERPLPAELATEQAMGYWRKLEQAGFVTASFQRASTTSRRQAMYIALCFSDHLGLKTPWAAFQQFWNISHLAQEKKQMQDSGMLPPRAKEIDSAFTD